MVQVAGVWVRPGLMILEAVSWEVMVLKWIQGSLTVVLVLQRIATTGPSWQLAADQHQIMGSGSSYYLREGQPRQLQRQFQGQMVQSKDVRAHEVDKHGAGGTSGSGVDDLDTTFEGDDPVDVVPRASSLIGDQSITPEQRHSTLVGDSNVTEVQLCSLSDSTYAILERRHSSLIGSLQTTEEQRHPTAAAVCLQGESITGFRPHSSHVSADGSCSDSVDYKANDGSGPRSDGGR